MEPYTGRLFKVLGDNQQSCHGGDHQWVPGEWVKVKGKLIPCQRGIHLCREQNLVEWLGPEIWAAEYRGEEFINHSDKVVVREARIITKYGNWNNTTARLLACDFAEKVVHLCGDDPRPAEAIRVARLFANGQATRGELGSARDAAWDAARDAARDAAWDAARDAAWDAAEAATWDAARAAARDSARDSARDAARAAARDSAWDAAEAAARAAARDAARDAAWDAAEAAARDAAWAAARDSARDSARDAAWNEMRLWQTKQLLALLIQPSGAWRRGPEI